MEIIEAVLAWLVQEAEPDEPAQLDDMSEDERRRLVVLNREEPDKYK